MFEGVYWKFYRELMIVGNRDYRKTLIKISLLSHGAVSFEYLEKCRCGIIEEFDIAGKEVAEIIKNG